MRPSEHGNGVILNEFKEIGLLRDAFNNAHAYMPNVFTHALSIILPDVDLIMDRHEMLLAELRKQSKPAYTPYLMLNITQSSVAGLLLAHYIECMYDDEPPVAASALHMQDELGACLTHSLLLRGIDQEGEALNTLDD